MKSAIIWSIVQVVASFIGIWLFIKMLGHQLFERFVSAVAMSLRRIEKQVTPNGGNSGALGDRVIQLHDTVAKLDDRLDRIEKHIGL